MTPTGPLDAAFVEDAEKVREFLTEAQSIVADHTRFHDDTAHCDCEVEEKFLAIIAHRDAQLAAAEEKLRLAESVELEKGRAFETVRGWARTAEEKLAAAERQLVAAEERIVSLMDDLTNTEARALNWEEDAQRYARNSDYWKGRMEAAERQLAAVRARLQNPHCAPTPCYGAPGCHKVDWKGWTHTDKCRELCILLAADPPRVAPVDRLTPDQRKSVEMARADHIQEHGLTRAFARGDRERLLAILDEHCPRPPVHVPCMDCDTFDCTEDDGAPCTCVCHPKPRSRPEPEGEK